MSKIQFSAIDTAPIQKIWAGGRDSYDRMPEEHVSEGDGMPCRHCLKNINLGERYLILAWRPFPSLQAFAETGPIFLHAEPCPAFRDDDGALPEILASPDYIVRGYGADDRIVYGSGAVTPTDAIAARAQQLLDDERIAYVHVRSARNNCFQCRIDRRA